MDQSQNLHSKIFKISERNFDQVALEIFKYQSKNNLIYKKYLKLSGVNVNRVKHIREIPFMPIDFFLRILKSQVGIGNLKQLS